MNSESKAPRPLSTSLTILAGVLVALFRSLIPHPPGFTPVGGLGLYAGGRLQRWFAYALPIGMMIASDVILWAWTKDAQYSIWHITRAYVYLSVVFYVVIGHLLRNRQSIGWMTAASLLGSIQFFVVTNFCTWLFQPWQPEAIDPQFLYSRDLPGLLNCFVAGLPFYQGEPLFDIHAIIAGDYRFNLFYTMVGDLIFTFVFYGLHATLAKFVFPAEQIPTRLQPTQV